MGFRGARPIVLIVTDGQPTDSVTAAVGALTALETEIYAITIGTWATDVIVGTIVNGPVSERVRSKYCCNYIYQIPHHDFNNPLTISSSCISKQGSCNFKQHDIAY